MLEALYRTIDAIKFETPDIPAGFQKIFLKSELLSFLKSSKNVQDKIVPFYFLLQKHVETDYSIFQLLFFKI